MTSLMSELLRIETPYEQFSKKFKEVVNSNIFTKNKVKIFTLQTGGGKSYFQDTEMPLVLKNAFPDLKYIFRLSPTLEVANDGTFEECSQLNDDYKFTYSKDPRTDLLNAFGDIPNHVACITITHTFFIHNFTDLIKYAPNSVLCIEEAHQFIGCADAGPIPYQATTGYSSNYTAETWQRIERWKNVNPRVIGFTATPTVHHTQKDKTLSNQFDTVNELANLESILPYQKWLNNTHQYSLERYQGARDIVNSVQDSISLLFAKEEKLEELSEEDPNINPKLTGFYICGDTRGAWGCPIQANSNHPDKKHPWLGDIGVKEIIADHLLSLGFDPTDKMIATMVEGSSGGCTVWDLEGNHEGGKKLTAQQLFDRMKDPNDPLRFLLAIKRGGSGINVPNLAVNVICRIRDPKEVRTHIPVQIYGRMVRINPGTGDIIRDQYNNSLSQYLENYHKDYNIPLETVIETIKVANTFEIWYPENGKAQRTWKESLVDFKEYYVNSSEEGFKWLYDFSEVEKPPLCSHGSDNEILVNCPWCGKNINAQIEENGTVTLDRFFEM